MNRITYEERKATYLAALTKWGAQAQTMMAVEEMAELTKEICKLFRGKADMENLADEIADATIMLEQLRLMYNLNDAVCEHMDAKVLRLQSRIGMVPEKAEAEIIHEKQAAIPEVEPDEFDLAMIAEAGLEEGSHDPDGPGIPSYSMATKRAPKKKAPPKGTKECRHNSGVLCDYWKCDGCGFNPRKAGT